jgi:cyclohexyl-isocyanide hydratase
MANTALITEETNNRRKFLQYMPILGGAVMATPWMASSANAQGAASAHEAAKSQTTTSSGASLPTKWQGSEQIAMLIYPEFTAIDLVAPQYFLAGLMGAKVHLVAASRDPVKTDTGLVFVPSMTLDECPRDLDMLFIPGGTRGTVNVMRDKSLINWIAATGHRAKLVASVCTGSMILAQAGLLRGKRATSHWVTREILRQFGAIPVNERVVWDGNVVTGAGVSAGIDLGLAISARLRDDTYAQAQQLLAEYAPRPPFHSGTPETAPSNVFELVNGRFESLRTQMVECARDSLGASSHDV